MDPVRLIRLWETGLLQYWRENLANSRQCLDIYKQKENKTKLGLKNLSASFIFLMAGMFAGVLHFVAEITIIRKWRTFTACSMEIQA
jgi:hypothetical protein